LILTRRQKNYELVKDFQAHLSVRDPHSETYIYINT